MHSTALSNRNFQGIKYGGEELIPAAVTHLIVGAITKTAREVGIPESTLRG
jgi:hypothetical protein